MAQYINMVPVELMNGAAPVISLRQVHQGDHNANRVGAVVSMNGEPYELEGSCAGTAILADGSTVPLSGTVSGNEAYVVLDSACYQVEGHLHVFVAWISGENETTLVEAIGTVQITDTGRVIQPSVPIPSLPQLLAEIDAMRDATAEAEAAAEKSVRFDTHQSLTRDQMNTARLNIAAASYIDIAPTFLSSETYAAGDVVMYQGSLYRFYTAHAAGPWTGSDAGTITVEEAALWRFVRFDVAQNLSAAQKANARQNIGVPQVPQVMPTDSSGDSSGMYIEY